MIWFILFLFEIGALFFLSQQLSKKLSSIFYRITKSQELTIHLLAFFFFPGVVIHELSHFFIAEMLFVHTGDIEFFPKIHGDVVKLGSVQVGKTDPFRRFLIGVAPLLVGVGAFFLIFSSLKGGIPGFNWQTLLTVYIYFEIGNTMFSSKRDMEGAVALLIAITILFIFLFILGLRLSFSLSWFFTFPGIVSFFRTTDILLLIPLAGDILVILLSHLSLRT